MSDLENFTLSESSEGADSGAFERLKEKMAQARGQIAKDKKQEGKQKKQEDTLFNVIQELLKHLPPSHPLIKKVVGALSVSIPSQLLLVIISLNYNSLHKTVGLTQSEENSKTKQLINLSQQLDTNTSNNLQTLFRWVNLVKKTIQNSKKSDLENIFIQDQFNPKVSDLLFYTINSFITKKLTVDLEVDAKQTLVENIILEINSPLDPELQPKAIQNPQAS